MNKNNQKYMQLPYHLKIVFIVVFLMFALLILQLGIVQIIEGKSFQTEIDRTIDDTTKIPVPRGKIYDRKHKLVVDNEAMYSITYTPPKRVQAADKLKLAQKLVHYMTLDEKNVKRITERNKIGRAHV